jgi:antitoxin (DNA-binding transcriptional repressor) of toxin-antitoxin stability system
MPIEIARLRNKLSQKLYRVKKYGTNKNIGKVGMTYQNV